jgi:hypothetical protein
MKLFPFRYGPALAVGLLCLLAACNSKPLPEAESASAQTYVKTCGGCHVLYNPESFTAGMWSTIVNRMERELTRRGRPLPPATKTEILDYLQRNAGER